MAAESTALPRLASQKAAMLSRSGAAASMAATSVSMRMAGSVKALTNSADVIVRTPSVGALRSTAPSKWTLPLVTT